MNYPRAKYNERNIQRMYFFILRCKFTVMKFTYDDMEYQIMLRDECMPSFTSSKANVSLYKR